jgi:acyl carrier protein
MSGRLLSTISRRSDRSTLPASAPTRTFVEDLSADSLDLVEIFFSIEDQFDREITEDQAATVETVRDAIDLIKHER